MKDIASLSDSELRDELIKYNVSVGPVTGTTRSLYEKKLFKLIKEGASKVHSTPSPKEKASPAMKHSSPSKSPTRLSFNSRTTSQSSTRRKTTRSESEEGSDEDAVANSTFGKPLVSTPESPDEIARPTSTILPKQTARSSDRRFHTTPSPPRSLPHVVRRYDDGDQPGSTPPRKSALPKTPPRPSTRVTTTTSYTLSQDSDHSGLLNRSSKTTYGSSSIGSRGLLDFGNTTGNEEDDDDDDGQESSRYIYTTKTTGPEKRSPLRRAWENLLGYDFKAGEVPGSQYELRHGSTRTRVERDPRTGRIRVQQNSIGRDISTILMMTLIVFFVLLAVAYVGTVRQDSVAATAHTIIGAIRDTFQFFYLYAIKPCLIILAAAAAVLGVYFGHKKWTQMREKDEAAFYDLVDRILDIVRESSENGEEYISIPHVRDIMFPPAKRRGAELARWERAVDFINENESRVATETRVFRGGQECDVWRWIPAKRTGWQGSGRL
ncbi:hypothetical protein KIN20_012512 [Parelaphostrongylus tenuis]|uniref:LEM domain-containing protein n=1 Tax=Parelaphostrongylus tenuis TaxID=148309 RepID=A0AAD5MAT1_PARTN|nr:hypothetical protein KIN20_012512 [Parelaphostrongylus tenuis]